MIRFDNSYARLPEHMFARLPPTAVRAPELVALNRPLAARLGLDADWLASDDGVAMLAGNSVPEGAAPLAQAYAGHQFGDFVPQLGDGRALLLGEIVAPDGKRFDIQLKGSGRTPFSRMGDGRAGIGPVMREYLVSEFMAAMGVPTTRALAAVTTGEDVIRNRAEPGAVLTRIAASHIRVGTFQYFAVRKDIEALRALTDHVIARHYPEADGPLALLDAVVAAQAETVIQWMALGFIHGVMNTDNMAVSGETIDYGPCAFMDVFHPETVFSSIDRGGRYAWSVQPQVAVWNLAQFASCLLPLIGEGEEAVKAVTDSVQRFPEHHDVEFLARFAAKLGLRDPVDEDRMLIEQLLMIMTHGDADFTRTFAGLSDGSARTEFRDPSRFDAWAEQWQQRTEGQLHLAAMSRANPRRIPRNHRIEEVIAAARDGDHAPFHDLMSALCHPREDRPEWDRYALAPSAEERVRTTYCGT